jgi:hypothetical protein
MTPPGEKPSNLQHDIDLLKSILGDSEVTADSGDDAASLNELFSRLDKVDGVASAIESKLDGVLGNLDSLLDSLEKKVVADAEKRKTEQANTADVKDT